MPRLILRHADAATPIMILRLCQQDVVAPLRCRRCRRFPSCRHDAALLIRRRLITRDFRAATPLRLPLFITRMRARYI